MALGDLIPAILSGAAAIFGPEPAGPEYERISAGYANIPNAPQIEAAQAGRANAALPFATSPFRTIDFGFGLPSTVQQTPQFIPGAGQAQFNANYGGGYSPGYQTNYQAQAPFTGQGVNPIYGTNIRPTATAMGGSQPQQQPQGQQQGSQGILASGPGAGIFYGAGGQQGAAGAGGQGGGGGNPANVQGGGTSTPNEGGQAPGQPYPITAAAYTGFGSNPSPIAPPSQEYQNAFTPNIFRDPFVSGLNAAANIGSFAAQAVPGASQFQSGLYDPNLNAHETNFLTAGANLGLRGLESAFNQINSQYENTPFAASRGRQLYDAANQFGDQMMQTAGDMGMKRQALATQNLPTAFGTPLQANQYGQQSAAGLYNLFDNAMYGDLNYPTSLYAGYPVQPDTFLQTN